MMRMWARIVLSFVAVLLWFAWSIAHAQTPVTTQTYSWTAPTAYADGKALPASDIWFYTLSWHGATTEGWMPYNAVQLDPTQLSYPVSMYCGAYTVTLTVTTTLTAAEPFTTSMPESLTYDTGTTCPIDFEFFDEISVQ